MTRVLFFALLLLLNPASAAFAQTANEKAEALLRRELRERRVPGLQAAVVKNGRIVLLKSFGVADLQTTTPVTNALTRARPTKHERHPAAKETRSGL